MSLTEKQKENRKEWIEALRSGEYEQGQESLKVLGIGLIDNAAYCCLGVFCKISDEDPKEDLTLCKYPAGAGIDIRGECGISHNEQMALAAMNDRGYSFDEIADVIEEDFSEEVAERIGVLGIMEGRGIFNDV